MSKINALLLSRVDREDYWVSCGIVFHVSDTESYESAFNEVRQQIQQPNVVSKVREHYEGEENAFGSFVDVTWFGYGVVFQFENIEIHFQPDFVFVASQDK